jgi:hypothetical protein
LLVKLSVALAVPETVGLKVTVKDALPPAGMVAGNARPPRLKTPESVVVAVLMVTLPPVAIRVPDALPLDPTTTLPRFMAVGVTLSVPTAEVPDPESGTASVGFDAFDVTVALPLAVPEEAGVKVTLKFVLWPALKVNGRLIPFTLNPLPLAVTPEIVTLVPPLFVTVSDRV